MNHIERKIIRIIENHITLKMKVPSYRRLSQYTGRPEKNIRNIIQKLKCDGLLDHIHTDEEGRVYIREKKDTDRSNDLFIRHELY